MNLIVVLYDGIQNSVFESQVLAPILKKIRNSNDLRIVIVSFESTPLLDDQLATLRLLHSRLHITILKKSTPFLGMLSVVREAQLLQPIITSYTEYELLARGPIAGAICQKTLTQQCARFTLQARGLLAEEYAYTHHTKTGIKQIIHQLKIWYLRAFEKKAYTWKPHDPVHFTIECVSPALQKYIETHYGTDGTLCSIAHEDLPDFIPKEERATWFHAIRSLLEIPETSNVYVYNGSFKPWQCFEETIDFFYSQYQQNPTSFLLVLSQDATECEKIITSYHLSKSCYKVLTVPHHNVMHYLCAANKGLLFRKPHILNWISRPTKALEYHAAGLEIIHNKTVAYLDYLCPTIPNKLHN